jgi:hypothetical protein
VAKWAKGTYRTDGRATSSLKIKNPNYSQAEGRYELFERRRSEYEGHGRTLIRTDLVLA